MHVMKNSPRSPHAAPLLAAIITLCAVAAQANDAIIYAAGDIASCPKKQAIAATDAAKTAALVLAGLNRNPGAVALTMGDNTYPDGKAAEFTGCYAPTWGQFKARTHPAPGNHDYRTPGAAGYYDYFGALAGPDRRGYYSVQLGQWQILSLNSYLHPAEHAAQLTWLKAELAAHPSDCTLAYWHHPVFSSGGHGDDPRMADAWKILQAANVDLILSGHDHDYERFAPQDSSGKADPQHGIREFVVQPLIPGFEIADL